ncbi:hypothetical protein N9C10_03585 [Flavobacteriaceae bacterium]|nr:hypothetical protein [Flavobacteriaceae bacterium]
MCSVNSDADMWNEAKAHCRWKGALNTTIATEIEPNLNSFKNKTFDYIFKTIYGIFKNVKGLGKLSTYDVSSSICRKFKIPINNVYIIGGGPKRAINILNIEKHYDYKLKIYYAKRDDVLKEHGNESMTNDELESSLCNWQKEN